MIKETFKNLIYMARRFKLATTLNLLGPILAYIAFYLLMTQISYQRSYNHGVQDHERIYRMECSYLFPEWGYSDNMCRPFAEALDRLPQVETYSLVNSGFNTFDFMKQDDVKSYNITNGNNTVISTLAGQALDGELTWTDEDQDGYVIPASIAMDYFGTTRAAGKEMTLLYAGEKYPVTVRGVYQDFPDNCEFPNYIYINMGDLEKSSLNFSLKCYVKFKEPIQDLAACNRVIKQAIIQEINEDTVIAHYTNEHDLKLIKQNVQNTDIRLTPLEDSFFESTTYTDGIKGYHGMYYFLILASVLVVIIGTINFLNCSLVESPMRIKSINTRLVLGAARSRLQWQLILESIITSLGACIVALLLCVVLSHQPSLYQDLLKGNILLCSHWKLALLMLAMSIVLGVIAEWYPARFATSFQPAIALKTSFGLTPQGIRLRAVLVFLQLLVSMTMVIYIGILFMQSQYIYTSDYGFDKDRILMTTLPPDLDSLGKQQIYHELKNSPDIEGVTFSNNPLASTDAQDIVRTDIDGKPFWYRKLNIDPDYLRVLGIRVIEGRDFTSSDSAVMIVNENARELMKLGTKISTGFGVQNEDSALVIGVCKNIRYGTMRMTQDRPFAFIVDKPDYQFNLNLRMSPNANRSQVSQFVTDLIKKHTNSQPNELVPYNEALFDTYQYELLYFRQIYTTSFICILLTLVGLFCLSMFETEYRRKEIGIRKVAGATTREIVMMLNKHYVKFILISFAIATPIAYQLGKNTLQYFADSMPIDGWILPIALIALLLGGGVTLVTVILQSWRAARENPVNSIKTQ